MASNYTPPDPKDRGPIRDYQAPQPNVTIVRNPLRLMKQFKDAGKEIPIVLQLWHDSKDGQKERQKWGEDGPDDSQVQQ
jgi:hypothetical protein